MFLGGEGESEHANPKRTRLRVCPAPRGVGGVRNLGNSLCCFVKQTGL